MNWQSIETAPKDGTSVLLGEFFKGYNTEPYVASWGNLAKEGYKWVGADCDVCPFDPTHWMPLPEPPTP